jgi:hypothetical protein
MEADFSQRMGGWGERGYNAAKSFKTYLCKSPHHFCYSFNQNEYNLEGNSEIFMIL